MWSHVLPHDTMALSCCLVSLLPCFVVALSSCPFPLGLPCRYMTGPFGWLVTRCRAQKRSFGQVYYGVDACMSNLMRPGMYGSYHHITIPAREDASLFLEAAAVKDDGGEAASAATPSEGRGGRGLRNVVGTLCENNDWFAKVRRETALKYATACQLKSRMFGVRLLFLYSRLRGFPVGVGREGRYSTVNTVDEID